MAKEPVQEAATQAHVEQRISEQFTLNFVPTPEGMNFIIGTGAFKKEIFTIPAAAMTEASKQWALFLKQQQDVQRAVHEVQRNPRGPLRLHDR